MTPTPGLSPQIYVGDKTIFNDMPQYYLSWNHLVTRPSVPVSTQPITKLDMVIVPTIKHPHHLVHAASVAKHTGAKLLVLTSGQADPAAATTFLAHEGFTDVTAVQIDTNTKLRGLTLQTDNLSEYGQGTDTSIKRNVGIAVAKITGAKIVWFIDDDISGIGPREINATLSQFDNQECQIAGWSYGAADPDSRDHSNETHAWNHLQKAKKTGKRWDTFIGGGSMAIRTNTSEVPFFPQIYNEDWIYTFWALAKGRGAVVNVGALEQQPRDPFQSHNSIDQTFGNILAPGLFRAVDIGRRHAIDPLELIQQTAFWQAHLHKRMSFLADLCHQLDQMNDLDEKTHQARIEIHKIILAIDEKTWPGMLLGYSQALIADLERWQAWTRQLKVASPFDSVEDALKQLIMS